MHRLLKFMAVIGLVVSSGISGCGGDGTIPSQQFSGIVSELDFETSACQPQEKVLRIRNDDMSNPKRIQQALFEMGTNPKNYFKIKKATLGSVEYKAQANVLEEVLMPAGSTLELTVEYNPREVTSKKNPTHTTYLSVKSNSGPEVGIIQYKLVGKAPTTLAGCLDRGDLSVFQVTKVHVTIADKDIVEDPAKGTTTGKIEQDITADKVTGDFSFSLKNSEATLTDETFPKFNIPAPGSGFKDGIEINLISDSYTGTFDGSNLTFEKTAFNAGGVLKVFDVMLTTGTVDVSGDDASISVSGSPLQGKDMKIVFAAEIPQNDQLKELNGGVIAVEITLQQK